MKITWSTPLSNGNVITVSRIENVSKVKRCSTGYIEGGIHDQPFVVNMTVLKYGEEYHPDYIIGQEILELRPRFEA